MALSSMTMAQPSPTGRIAPERRALLTFSPPAHLDQARVLIDAIQRLSLAESVAQVQEVVRVAARRLTGADGATFVLREGDLCHYADEDAISPLWKGQRFPMSTCISGWAMLNRRAAAIEDIYADERIPHDAYRPTFVKSLVMVPIRTLDPIGAIGNYWASRHAPSTEEIELLQSLADSTAVAMENVRIYETLETERAETLNRLALVAEYRDDDTFHHTRRVARTAYFLASELGLDSNAASLIRQAAPLHDIGKLAVSDSILLKPGRLDPDEMRQVRGHVAAGAEILAGSHSDVLRVAEEIALTHHEWWDGSGYPTGIAGEEIPLSGRIVALADVFDALTHTRPYKPAWPLADAVAEIRRLDGSQFDPQIVAAFETLDRQELMLPVGPA